MFPQHIKWNRPRVARLANATMIRDSTINSFNKKRAVIRLLIPRLTIYRRNRGIEPDPFNEFPENNNATSQFIAAL